MSGKNGVRFVPRSAAAGLVRLGVPGSASLAGRALVAGLCLTWFGAAGSAVTAAPFFTMTGGTAVTTEKESFLWVTPRFDGDKVLLWEGGVLGLSEPGFITLEYIGKEADYNNVFRWSGVDIFSTGTSPGVAGQQAAEPFPPNALATFVVPNVVNAGPLPFSFYVTDLDIEVLNTEASEFIGYWPIPPGIQNDPVDFNFGSVVYVLLDDENPADFDHDDMIVRITVAPVPEPATLAAIGIPALAAWIVLRQRRRFVPRLAAARGADLETAGAGAAAPGP
jgi:hypothetical protein